jgi:hypothetical protein
LSKNSLKIIFEDGYFETRKGHYLYGIKHNGKRPVLIEFYGTYPSEDAIQQATYCVHVNKGKVVVKE